MTIAEELIQNMKTIEDFSKDIHQDASALHEYLLQLSQFMARANFIMAEYKKKFREQKTKSYLNLIASSHAQQQYFSPSQAKDYVDSQCSESGYIYDLAERLSRLCVHVSDAVRTIVSSLKSERTFAQYGT